MKKRFHIVFLFFSAVRTQRKWLSSIPFWYWPFLFSATCFFTVLQKLNTMKSYKYPSELIKRESIYYVCCYVCTYVCEREKKRDDSSQIEVF